MRDAIMLWIAKDITPLVEFLIIGGALALYCIGRAVHATLMEKLRENKEDGNA